MIISSIEDFLVAPETNIFQDLWEWSVFLVLCCFVGVFGLVFFWGGFVFFVFWVFIENTEYTKVIISLHPIRMINYLHCKHLHLKLRDWSKKIFNFYFFCGNKNYKAHLELYDLLKMIVYTAIINVHDCKMGKMHELHWLM